MAKVTLRANATCDIASDEELCRRFDDFKEFFRNEVLAQEGETVVRAANSVTTDASGNATIPAYTVPVGYDAYLTRLTVDFAGSTFKTVVSCDARIVADVNTPAALRAGNGSVPWVYEASKSHAPLFRGGQTATVILTGAGTTTLIYCHVQVILTPRHATRADALT